MPNRTRTSLMALLLAAPLAATPALAEQHTSGDDAASSSSSSMTSDDPSTDTQMPTADGQDSTSTAVGTDGETQADPLIATVGETEITASDVETALMAFPPQVRQTQPPEMLIPMAVEQLILRELVLQAAMSENMAENEDVQRIVEENSQRTEEDAMVQVYVEREMEGAVTDQAVQDTYDQIASNSETEVPPLDAVRPQIEQQLRQQRMDEMGESLRADAEIVFYGPDGQPQQASSQGGNTGATGSGSNSSTGGNSSTGSSSSAGGNSSTGNNSSTGGNSGTASGSGSANTGSSGATSVQDNMSDDSSGSSSQN